jgi:predicted transcriptional regulator
MDQTANLIRLTAEIVGAYVGNNPVPQIALSGLIADVHSSLTKIEQPKIIEPPKQEPAVNPKRSVFPDYIVSLEDGKKYKSLKRTLMARHGLTPDQYREKWDLPRDYPMVAPNYSATRSELARSSGLGQIRKKSARKAKAPRPKK